MQIFNAATGENHYNKSFNGKLWDELLDREIFDTLLEAKVLIDRWRVEYNTIRSYSALDYRPWRGLPILLYVIEDRSQLQ